MKDLLLKFELGFRENMVIEKKTKFKSYVMADEIQFSNCKNKPLVRPFINYCDILGFVGELVLLRGCSVSDISF